MLSITIYSCYSAALWIDDWSVLFCHFLTKYNIRIEAQYIHNSKKAGKITPHIYKQNKVKYIKQEYTESLSIAPLVVKMNKSFAIPVSSCIARDVHLFIMVYIWVRSRNCGRVATRPCYQLIAKPGNKTATVSWPDPYSDFKSNNKRLFLINEPIVERNIVPAVSHFFLPLIWNKWYINLYQFHVTSTRVKQSKYRTGWNHFGSLWHWLKRKCHFDEIVITDCTRSCHIDNFQCKQWWKFHQN